MDEDATLSSEGVSPIIATVIMVGIVVGAAAAFNAFYGTFQQGRQAQVEQEGETTVECSFSEIDFTEDDVEHNLTPTSPKNDTVNITIDNSGSVDLYDFEITLWVDDVTHTYDPDEDTQKTASNPLEAGARHTLVTNITDDLSGTLNSVRVIGKNCPISAKKVDL